MIDKNFYLENLSAFDILIQDNRAEAEKVIFKIYCILQRDKIWINEIAEEEEYDYEDEDLLRDVELEIKELDQKHQFNFASFHKIVEQEMRKQQFSNRKKKEDTDEIKSQFNKAETLIDANTPIETLSTEEEVEENDDEPKIHSMDDFEVQQNESSQSIPYNPINQPNFVDEDNEDYIDDEEDDDDELLYDDEDNYLQDLSDDEIDLITNYILNSAKNRINYDKLLELFPGVPEEFIDENFILPIIAEKANEETDETILSKLAPLFEYEGHPIEDQDLLSLIQEKSKDLGLEILSFRIAADSLQQGAYPDQVISQISQLLG